VRKVAGKGAKDFFGNVSKDGHPNDSPSNERILSTRFCCVNEFSQCCHSDLVGISLKEGFWTSQNDSVSTWIPAFAGMTEKGTGDFIPLFSLFC